MVTFVPMSQCVGMLHFQHNIVTCTGHYANSGGLALRPQGTQLLGLGARRVGQDPEGMERGG